MARLGDYITQIRGVSYKPEDVYDFCSEDTVPLLRAGNIHDGRIDFSDIIYVSKNRVSPSQYLKKGDIIICSSSGSKSVVGKAAIAEEDLPYTFGAFCKVIRTQAIVKSYLGYFFQSPRYRNTISELAAGANINNIRNEHIDDLTIPIYNDEEQAYISSLLDNATHMISLYKRQLAKLDELVKARFVEMFGDCATYEELGNLSTLITKGSSPRWQGINYTESGVLFITSENVREGYIDHSRQKFLDEQINDIQPRSILKKDDILINIVGASIGRAAVFTENISANINQAVALVRLKPNCIDLTYLITYLNSGQAMKAYKAMKKGGARDNLSLDNISSLQIPLAPYSAQANFSSFATQVEESKTAVQRSLDRAQLLFDSLMQKYFG